MDVMVGKCSGGLK